MNYFDEIVMKNIKKMDKNGCPKKDGKNNF